MELARKTPSDRSLPAFVVGRASGSAVEWRGCSWFFSCHFLSNVWGLVVGIGFARFFFGWGNARLQAVQGWEAFFKTSIRLGERPSHKGFRLRSFFFKQLTLSPANKSPNYNFLWKLNGFLQAEVNYFHLPFPLYYSRDSRFPSFSKPNNVAPQPISWAWESWGKPWAVVGVGGGRAGRERELKGVFFVLRSSTCFFPLLFVAFYFSYFLEGFLLELVILGSFWALEATFFVLLQDAENPPESLFG